MATALTVEERLTALEQQMAALSRQQRQSQPAASWFEKIAGSFHFTPGQAYDVADNGNRSEVHWDMGCIQRPDFGGGENYFDGKLIRKDGLFVVPALEGLNPENLKGV